MSAQNPAPLSAAAHDEHLEALFRQAAAGMAQVDLTGRFLRINDHYCFIVGRTREELLGIRMQDITHAEDLPQNEALFRSLVQSGEGFEIEKRYLRPDGTIVWARNAVSPIRDAAGGITTALGVCVDITARKAAEEALRVSQRRLNAVLNNATVAIFLMDEHQHCVYMNAAAEKLTGYTLAETHRRALHDIVHHTRPDGSHHPIHECPIDRAFPERHQMQGEEIFVHKDGTFYPVAFTASPIQDELSQTIGTIVEVRDIRAERQAEEQQRLLIDELNHRVKNTLATVQSIASQTLRRPDVADEAKRALEERLLALSRAHDVLTRENWEGAGLHEIVARAVEPYANLAEDRLHLVGPKVRLPPRMALALAMALQELATNALKYGALSSPAGEIWVVWRVDPMRDPARLYLEWRETGGPPVQAPSRRGFGSRLIERSLGPDLGGSVRLAFEPEGLVCAVDAALPRSAGLR